MRARQNATLQRYVKEEGLIPVIQAIEEICNINALIAQQEERAYRHECWRKAAEALSYLRLPNI